MQCRERHAPPPTRHRVRCDVENLHRGGRLRFAIYRSIATRSAEVLETGWRRAPSERQKEARAYGQNLPTGCDPLSARLHRRRWLSSRSNLRCLNSHAMRFASSGLCVEVLSKSRCRVLPKVFDGPADRSFVRTVNRLKFPKQLTPRSTDAYPPTGSKIFVGEYGGTTPVGSGESATSGRRRWQSGVPDRPRAERGGGAHVGVRAALRRHRCVAMDTEPDLVRQPELRRDANYYVEQCSPRTGETVVIAREGKPVTGRDGLFASAATVDGGRGFRVTLVKSTRRADAGAHRGPRSGRCGRQGRVHRGGSGQPRTASRSPIA